MVVGSGMCTCSVVSVPRQQRLVFARQRRVPVPAAQQQQAGGLREGRVHHAVVEDAVAWRAAGGLGVACLARGILKVRALTHTHTHTHTRRNHH